MSAVSAASVGFFFSPWRLLNMFIHIYKQMSPKTLVCSIFCRVFSCCQHRSRFICFPTSVTAVTPSHISVTLHNSPSPIPWPLFFSPRPCLRCFRPTCHILIRINLLSVCMPCLCFCGPCLLLFCTPSVPHACRVSALTLRVLLCVSRTHDLRLCQLCCEDGSTHIEVSSSDGNLIFVLRRVQ